MRDTASFDDALARIAFDLSPSGMLAMDAAGLIVAVNREVERLFGWPREELIGRSIDLLVPERFRARHPQHRDVYLKDPQVRPMGAGRELYGLHRDGTEFPVEIGLNPVRNGDVLNVIASIVDISARRAREESQRRSQKLEAVGVLAGGIAHDFNNILLSIVGHTELALRDPALGTQSRGDLVQVLRGAERGRDLVKRILLFSRDAVVTRVPVDLGSSIGEALKLIRASLPASVEISSQFDPGATTILSDETQIHQILMNLATNSAHAMPAGGTITVRVQPFQVTAEFAGAHPGIEPGPHARLVVSDTGSGMPPEVIERALEPFFTTKGPGQGTGLGLSVIHGIVRGHRGLLEIASVPDHGTTVTIYLPAGEVAREPVMAKERPIAAPSGPHVLFVDDEAVLASMQQRQLQYLGYEVTMHTSSPEALEDFRSRPEAFALLITDDSMPHMTGTALAREVRTIRPTLPILMISGGEGVDPLRVREIGVHRVLRKPHTIAELERAIREILASR
ncbi:MAG: ATP-binding protein [Candidatus Eisenbacteria bacterium]